MHKTQAVKKYTETQLQYCVYAEAIEIAPINWCPGICSSSQINSRRVNSSWWSQSRCIRWASPTGAGCTWPAALTHYLQTAWSRNRPPGSPGRRCWSVWFQWWRWDTARARRNNWTQTLWPCPGSTWGPEWGAQFNWETEKKEGIRKKCLLSNCLTVFELCLAFQEIRLLYFSLLNCAAMKLFQVKLGVFHQYS